MSNTDTMSVYFKVKGAKEAEKDLKQLGQRGSLALNDITASAKPVSSALVALNSSVGKVSKSMMTFSGVAGAYFSFHGLRSSVGNIMNTNAELQKLSAAMEVAEGSIDGANMVMEKLSSLATQTPYSINALTEAWIKLKNLGLEPSEQALLSYGNTASAMGKDIMQFIEAIADASTFEFERLKEFGIKVSQQNDEVAFTFQGNTTRIKKNAKDIEQYLREIGNVQFVGAMQKQMDTIGGAMSNLDDNFIRTQKIIGDSEFNDSVKNLLNSLSDVVSANQDTARSVGIALASVTNGITTVVENIDILDDVLIAFAGFKTLQTGAALTNSVMARTVTSTMGMAMAVQSGSTIAASAMATQASSMTISSRISVAAMGAMTVAARGLSSAMALVGGLPGIIAIAGFSVYQFTKETDEASKVAGKYADELAIVKKQTRELTTATNDLNSATSKVKKLEITSNIAEIKEDVKSARDELLNGNYWSDNWFTNQIERFNKDDTFDYYITRFKEGQISLRELESEIARIGESSPDHKEMSLKFADRLDAYKAANMALIKEEQKLAKLDPSQQTVFDFKVNTDVEKSEKFVPFAGLEDFIKDFEKNGKKQEESLDSLMNKARYAMSSVGRLENEMNVQIDPDSWIYGALNGLDELSNETTNYAKLAEDSLKNAFNAAEDTLVSFVMTGKLQFKDFVNSILEDILRMQIRQSITQPLAKGLSGALSGWFSGGGETTKAEVNHTGGTAGVRRIVPAEVFANAPRYHTGSTIHQDEKPVIMQKGEGIVSRQQMNELLRSKKQGNNISVNIVHQSKGENVQAQANVSQNSNGFNLDILIEEIEGKVANNVAKNRGSLNSVLNNKYQSNGVMV